MESFADAFLPVTTQWYTCRCLHCLAGKLVFPAEDVAAPVLQNIRHRPLWQCVLYWGLVVKSATTEGKSVWWLQRVAHHESPPSVGSLVLLCSTAGKPTTTWTCHSAQDALSLITVLASTAPEDEQHALNNLRERLYAFNTPCPAPAA